MVGLVPDSVRPTSRRVYQEKMDEEDTRDDRANRGTFRVYPCGSCSGCDDRCAGNGRRM